MFSTPAHLILNMLVWNIQYAAAEVHLGRAKDARSCAVSVMHDQLRARMTQYKNNEGVLCVRQRILEATRVDDITSRQPWSWIAAARQHHELSITSRESQR